MQFLIVEDHLDVLECLRLYFIEHGHEVMTACTVKEAVGWLECSNPHIAFIDLGLPGGSGRTVIQEIAKRNGIASRAARARNDDRGAGPRNDTRVVVITASHDLRLRQELMELGVTDYLFKPITIRDIEALLEMPAATPAPVSQPRK